MQDFTKALQDWTAEVKATMNGIFRDVVIDIGRSVVRLSPVDTGHFRGNWQLTIDNEESGELSREDISGSVTIADIVNKAGTLTAGQVAYIVNHVEYGYDLEYGTYFGPTAKVTPEGFSRQAPEGVLRITAARFSEIVNEAVRLNI